MMDVKKKLFEFKGPLVFAGLLVGLGSLFEVLPVVLPVLGSYTDYFYLGVIFLSGYVYWEFHWNSYGVKPVSPVRKVSPRTDLESVPSKRVFDTFKRED